MQPYKQEQGAKHIHVLGSLFLFIRLYNDSYQSG